MGKGVRIDKWLWSVRLFKTRSKATDACRSGKIHMGEQAVKPSREIFAGDIIVVRFREFTKTVEVVEILSKRVGAKLVDQYMKDLTPEEEYNKFEIMREINYEFRPRGLGRPTKKQRRIIDKLKNN